LAGGGGGEEDPFPGSTLSSVSGLGVRIEIKKTGFRNKKRLSVFYLER
jgi:hypothetical protein